MIINTFEIGPNQPVFVVAEIGINHNGSIDIAKKLIDAAIKAGANAVKFQKRTPEICVPDDQKNKMRETPWGYITYLEYKKKIEFGVQEFTEIDKYCKEKGIIWFASCWDIPSIDFIEQFNPPCYKIASASITDINLLNHHKKTNKPIILSTGMSTMDEIKKAVSIFDISNLVITHSTSTYPCDPHHLNLRMITTLKELFPCPIGYSGHEAGLVPSVAAVALGAQYIERHITLDRSMWGTDQSASVEPHGFERLVKYIRTVEIALGDGVKVVYDDEKKIIEKLRGINI